MVTAFYKTMGRVVCVLSLPFMLGAAELTSEDMGGWVKDIADQQQSFTGDPLQSPLETASAPQAQSLTASPERKVFKGRRTLIFVSRAMPDAELKSILLEHADDPTVQLVVRGFPEGVNTAQAIADLQRLVMATHSKAGVIIDPPAFKRHNVTAVPVTVLEEDEVALLTVRGNSSAQYVADAYAAGQRADLGTVGPTIDISERDLVDVMQERAHRLDFDALKKAAKDRFWANQQYFELGRVVENRMREIDPTVIVSQDILDSTGKVITARGTRINPLDVRPFNQRLVVFDGRDEAQVRLARKEYDEHAPMTRVTLILSALDTTDGWAEFQKLQGYLGAPLYVLTPEVLNTFALEKTPSIVYAAGNKFVVQEIEPAQ